MSAPVTTALAPQETANAAAARRVLAKFISCSFIAGKLPGPTCPVQWLRLYVRHLGKHPPCSGGNSLRCLPTGASVLPYRILGSSDDSDLRHLAAYHPLSMRTLRISCEVRVERHAIQPSPRHGIARCAISAPSDSGVLDPWTSASRESGPMKRYLVGGAVRDALLGRAGGDRDWVVVGADARTRCRAAATCRSAAISRCSCIRRRARNTRSRAPSARPRPAITASSSTPHPT